MGSVPNVQKVILSNGLTVSCVPGTAIQRLVDQVFGGTYTPDGEAWISPGDTVVDVGAHIGLFALFAARKAHRVLAFEPHPDNYSKMVENISQNNVANITPCNVAVGGTSGRRDLWLCERSEMHSLFINRDAKEAKLYSGQRLAVSVMALREVFDVHNVEYCNLLKMDCEGAEYEIILSAPDQVLEVCGAIVAEYHNNFTEFTGLRLSRHLEERGFAVTITAADAVGCGMLYARRTGRS